MKFIIDDTRGQKMGPHMGLTSVIIAGVVAYVGINIGANVQGESVERLCAGLWGCSGPPVEALTGAAFLAVLAVAAVAYLRYRTANQEQ